ncbi:hypothetical protein EDEG_02483 [Edhazardia aedis USNM 41457]|uniref:MRG domain-containing protein n=1 Tax=Edhazardia aedis (strain USNM 41457) TaxID=1003232 RepID=J9DKN0_EDHAE|nr:hypothetical protein EDEG_02483 [Edhazardia aedis USNM 41457]|eukprot:EJW03145.1 hypothetical protein EDEG_02483 [Edhazardia aedis USNM 41457]
MQKKFSVNNFILTKIDDEWTECRVVEIQSPEKHSTKFFMLHIINQNRIYPEVVPETSIHHSTTENQKKYRFNQKKIDIQIFGEIIEYMKNDKEKNKNGFVVSLPAKIPLKQIISDFCSHLSTNSSAIHEDEVAEINDGFLHTFNSCLKSNLLYENEIEQYDSVIRDSDTKPSEIYGLEHLLRVIYFIIYDNKEESDIINEICLYLCDFLTFNFKKYASESLYITNKL